ERLGRDCTSSAARRELEKWLTASPRHRNAYVRITSTWNVLGSAAHDPHILALRHEAALRLTRGTSRWVRPLAAAAALIIAILLGLVGSQMWQAGKWARAPDRYATAIGERLAVTLQDGSQVTLNSASDLEPSFDTRERRIALLKGQALFEVARDVARPF